MTPIIGFGPCMRVLLPQPQPISRSAGKKLIIMNQIVRIYGVGDNQERALVAALNRAAQELNVEIDVEVVTALTEFLRVKIEAIPALMIRNKIVVYGRVPEVDELKHLLAA